MERCRASIHVWSANPPRIGGSSGDRITIGLCTGRSSRNPSTLATMLPGRPSRSSPLAVRDKHWPFGKVGFPFTVSSLTPEAFQPIAPGWPRNEAFDSRSYSYSARRAVLVLEPPCPTLDSIPGSDWLEYEYEYPASHIHGEGTRISARHVPNAGGVEAGTG